MDYIFKKGVSLPPLVSGDWAMPLTTSTLAYWRSNMKLTVIRIYGYTKNPLAPHGHNPEPLDEYALIMPKDLSDSMRDEVLAEMYERKQTIGYIFNEGETIIGEHRAMTVVSFRTLDELEMGEVQ
jgi:hypothetical protein